MPVVAMAMGLMVLAFTGIVVVGSGQGSGADRQPTATTAAVVAPDPLAITLSARDVSVVTQVYEPGETSGWHSHPGIHAVAVLTGVLTVYDAECRAESYEPGRPYVGGQRPHLVRNETSTPVTMVVTYLNPSAPSASTTPLATPPVCTVG